MPDYDFRSLSPIDFELLVRDLLNADLNLQLDSFGAGPDGGIDLRDRREGHVTIAQCKHWPDARKAALIRAAEKEASRWSADAMQEYLFVVSCPISPGAELDIQAALTPLPVNSGSIWHKSRINAALLRNAKVERDHFKLWLSSAVALERILADKQWQRSEELLQSVSERARLYVHTPSYALAFEMLKEEHVVLISGSPGVGKSTLAEMILLSLWHEGWTVLNIASDVNEAWLKIRASEEKVVFYYDDFLGQTSTAELQKNEASGIALLMDKVRKGNGDRLLVLTSREQILGQARFGDDDRVRRLADDQAKIRLELLEIDRIGRARMLFNHLHFGFSDPSSRTALASDIRYRDVIDHDNFNPRILESVALRQKHSTVDDFYAAISYALDHPDEIWAASFQQLSPTAILILFQLAVWPSPSMPLESIRLAVSANDPRQWHGALKVLEHTWIRLHAASGAVERASLFDASRRDFLLDLLDDASYFDSALMRLSSLQQLNYLLRLSGITEDLFDAKVPDRRHLLAGFFERRRMDIDRIAVDLAREELNSAKKEELAQGMRNHPLRPGTSQLNSRPGYVFQNYSPRIKVLTELATVCWWASLPTIAASELLLSEIQSFEKDLAPDADISATALFGLAARLASTQAPAWSIEYAEIFASLAFDNVNDTEDLNAYSGLPQWFRDGPYRASAVRRLTAEIDGELQGIEQQNDPELMMQWLEDVVDLAKEHGIPLYVDGLRERIREMDEPVRLKSPSAAPIRDSSPMENGGTDDDLRELFARLG